MAAAFALIPPDHDDDPVDRQRGVDLGRDGLPGHGLAVVIGGDGEERFAIVQYNAGPADYWPADWSEVAPHEIPGLPVYLKP